MNCSGVPVLIIVIPAVAVSHATASWVFTEWIASYAKEDSGIESPFYIFMLGLLLPGFSFVGYDGPCNMAEEVADAANATPRSILVGFFFMAGVGWVWLVSLLFCITVTWL
jgi:amino acid transporter